MTIIIAPRLRRSRLRSNSTAFERLPLTVTRLSDGVGMIAASPGESRSVAGLSGHPNPSARSWQRQLSGERETRTTAILGTRESPRRLHANGGADFGIRLPPAKAQPPQEHPAPSSG